MKVLFDKPNAKRALLGAEATKPSDATLKSPLRHVCRIGKKVT